jgi:lipoprotein LprG
MTTTRTRIAAAALLLPLAAGVAGCSSSDQATATPQQTLSAAKKKLDATSGLHLVLSTDRLPAGVSGLLRAEGDATHDPAFKGAIKVSASGVTADAKVIAAEGTVYAVLPFTTHYVQIRPADYGAPDPAALMDTRTGLSSLLTASDNVKAGKQQRDGSAVLSTFSGTVPGSTVADVIPSADAKATFDATFTVDDQDRLHEAVLTGPFYPKGGDVTYTIDFSDYGSSPTITAP